MISTEDTVLGGKVQVLQPKRGARFSVDALQLADFAGRRSYTRAIDLGCGSGVIAFVLAYRAPRARVCGVEIDADLVALATKGVSRNGFGNRATMVKGDLRCIDTLVERAAFDLVVANPPYHQMATGRVSKEARRARAHHELACTLGEVLMAADFACAPRGRLALILPVTRLHDFLNRLPKRFRPTMLRFVHPRLDEPARRVLVEARPGGRETLAVLPPLVVHEGNSYSAEMRAMLGEKTI